MFLIITHVVFPSSVSKAKGFDSKETAKKGTGHLSEKEIMTNEAYKAKTDAMKFAGMGLLN